MVTGEIVKRALKLPVKPQGSYFLWGPRQIGKSFLLNQTYKESTYINLLKTDEYIKYLNKPWLLREEIEGLLAIKKINKKQPIIIDEIQRVPLLLDEVHYMIEEHGLVFVLCGSSARKVKRGHANLLGGRALRYELHGLTATELGAKFDLNKILNCGYIPKHYLSSNPNELIESYVANYLEEEISAEAIVRSVPVFTEFLRIAALMDTEIMNYSNIARDCGVSMPTIKQYVQILEDTLLANLLPSYIKRPKRRIIQAPKLYNFDIGLVNYLADRGPLRPKSDLYGKAFENWVYHELRAYNSYQKQNWRLSYWRLTTGVEVDFIINDMQVAIECKAKDKITSDDLKGLREIIQDHPTVKKRLLVSLVKEPRLTEDGILILPYMDFIEMLWAGLVT